MREPLWGLGTQRVKQSNRSDNTLLHNSRVQCAFSLIFRGEIVNYTFLEALISTELKKTFFPFFLNSLWQPSWIFNMAAMESLFLQYLYFYNAIKSLYVKIEFIIFEVKESN